MAPERQLGSEPAGEATTVPCPGCGREYDASLFRFGRTRHCTCGTRVGPTPRPSAPDPGRNPRFFADAMLGRLARWLRILGYDTSYEAHLEDAALVRRAIQEERVILTRDRALPAEQLRELVTRVQLDTEGRLFTRCSRCNAGLESVPRSQIAERVPARVLRDHDHFKHCPGCGRVYWEGSHVDRIRSAIRRALAP